MAESIFADKAAEPTGPALNEAIGRTASLLEELERELTEELGSLTHEWKFYGKKAGWTLALGYRGRRILHLIPREGRFTVIFTLGDRAVAACRESDLPSETLRQIEDARKYAEGRSIRFDVTKLEDVGLAMQLAAIKMTH